MCVVSNIGDHYGRRDQWPWRETPYIPEPLPPQTPPDFEKIWRDWEKQREFSNEALAKRIVALEELLKKGAQHDAATGQPHCEQDEKKARLAKLAEELGVVITFP